MFVTQKVEATVHQFPKKRFDLVRSRGLVDRDPRFYPVPLWDYAS
jgi:hypothetical protein